MKRNIAPTALVLMLLATLVARMVPAAQAQTCSNGTAAGAFGFTTTGSIIISTPNGPVPVPVVAVGRSTLDAAGNFRGSQTRSVGGDVARETIIGTGSINPNCTGRIIAQVFDSSGALVRTSTIDTVLVDNGRKLLAIFRKIVLPDGTTLPSALTAVADRVF